MARGMKVESRLALVVLGGAALFGGATVAAVRAESAQERAAQRVLKSRACMRAAERMLAHAAYLGAAPADGLSSEEASEEAEERRARAAETARLVADAAAAVADDPV